MTETDPTAPPAGSGEPRGTDPLLRIRLEHLEKETARLRRLTQGTLVITALLLGLAAAIVVVAARHGMPGLVPTVVESREFILRDKEGRVRGAWGQDDQGAIRFVLQDHTSQASVKINLLEDGSAGLTVADSAGNARAVLAFLPDETASLVFADRQGLTRTVLNLSRSGASTLLFADDGGNPQAGLGIDSRGQAMLMGEADSGPAERAEPADSVVPERRRRP